MSRGPWHVAVLMGGWSSERAVSLASGAEVAQALEKRGHLVTRIDMDRTIAERLSKISPDIVFNALHGSPGEDGRVQGMLDVMGMKYTHSSMAASFIAIDKQRTKDCLVRHGIRMPLGHVVQSADLFKADPLARPYVLKPCDGGSSLGVAIITKESKVGNPIAATAPGPWQYFDVLLAEPFIRGRELTVAVLGERALGVTELRPKSGFYDYDAKYTQGMTEHICPADIPVDIAAYIMDIAVRSHRLLGCKGTSRADFRWDDTLEREGVFLLEINTQPGMTQLSLVPEQARCCGMAYGELVEQILEEAL